MSKVCLLTRSEWLVLACLLRAAIDSRFEDSSASLVQCAWEANLSLIEAAEVINSLRQSGFALETDGRYAFQFDPDKIDLGIFLERSEMEEAEKGLPDQPTFEWG